MTSSRIIRAFVKSRAAAALGAALFIGCSGATPPDPPSDGAASSAGEPSQESNHTPLDGASRPRVVGYLPTYRLGEAQLHLETLTHLVIAFAIPNDSQEAVLPDTYHQKIVDVVSAAHSARVKVLVALAGGTDTKTKPALEKGVGRYIDSVMRIVDTYNLDGVDVDIEGNEIDAETYEPLMVGLAAKLRSGSEPKLLTAAVSLWRSENYRALGAVDFLNVMSYDHCPDTEHECEHATLDQAQHDLEYWASLKQADEHGTLRTIGAENVVLGVPFYGRCYGEVCPDRYQFKDGSYASTSNLTYQKIVDLCANGIFSGCSPSADVLTDGNGASGYYVSLNSPLTIGDKAAKAKGYGGLMIWELGQDNTDGALFAEVKRAFPKPAEDAGTSTVEVPSR